MADLDTLDTVDLDTADLVMAVGTVAGMVPPVTVDQVLTVATLRVLVIELLIPVAFTQQFHSNEMIILFYFHFFIEIYPFTISLVFLMLKKSQKNCK